MHEHSLMKNLMEKIITLAREQNAEQVVGLKVWLGALSHISPAHFLEHFDQAARDSIAEGATVDVETSEDIDHPQAQEIILKSVEIAEQD